MNFTIFYDFYRNLSTFLVVDQNSLKYCITVFIMKCGFPRTIDTQQSSSVEQLLQSSILRNKNGAGSEQWCDLQTTLIHQEPALLVLCEIMKKMTSSLKCSMSFKGFGGHDKKKSGFSRGFSFRKSLSKRSNPSEDWDDIFLGNAKRYCNYCNSHDDPWGWYLTQEETRHIIP